MRITSRNNILKILGVTFWICLGCATMFLLVAAMNKKNSMTCSGLDINISGVKNNLFIDKPDVASLLVKYSEKGVVGKIANSFNLAAIESDLQKNVWIKHAEVYFDNNEILKVRIAEREPIARIFCTDASSFYIDTALVRLPLSSKLSAQVPVFTNFPTTNIVLSPADSNLLRGIRKISEFIYTNEFWMAQIDQIDINTDRDFEMTPKIGNQVIVFGNADNYAEKFDNLLTFYKRVEKKIGWNKYSKLDLRFKGQVVAVKRGSEDIKSDSLRTKQLMQLLVMNALKQANDSIHNIQLVQPVEDNLLPLSRAEEIMLPENVGNLVNTLNPKETITVRPREKSLVILPVIKPVATDPLVRNTPTLKIIKHIPMKSQPNLKTHHDVKKTIIKKVTRPVQKAKPVNITNDY